AKMPHTLKLSEIKTNITTVIANLQQLETCSNVDQSTNLQQQTTALLSRLDQLPAKQIARLQLQRKRRRQRAKRKCKQQKSVDKAYAKHFKDTKVISPPLSDQAEQPKTTAKRAEHIALKKLHDANNKLKTFDLLERLYKARGGDKAAELSQKLSRMRAVWRRVKQECENATGGEMSVNLEAQWEQVIFGNPCAALEQLRRYVWDSYISNGNDATSIPSGWVLPPKTPLQEWAHFR
ncbi:hypothetical protein KR044_008519, partial [Drosophila immigrans]